MFKKFSQTVFSSNRIDKVVEVRFDQERASIDGGTLLLMKADERLSLSAILSGGIRDRREAHKIEHGTEELVRQRMYAMALGYSDANDAAKLRTDPVHQLMVKGQVGKEATLASQPSLSRLENGVSRTDIGRMMRGMMSAVFKRHKKRLRGKARAIVIDLDGTDDPTHGNQQLSFFNGYYDEHCYLPYVATVQFNEEQEQYVVGALLRPGNASASAGAIGVLRRIIAECRRHFPGAKICVRLDAGFGCPEVLEVLDDERVGYVVGFAANRVLETDASLLMRQAMKLSRQREETVTLFGETMYEAKSWDDERRVIFKAEALFNSKDDIRENPRFVVTNLKQSPQWVYRLYTGRGDMENRLKELHYGLALDRTSCHRFIANQFRVLLTSAAYVLFQEIQLCAKGTDCEGAQVWTLRERLFKLGAWVEQSVRRIVLHLPQCYVWLSSWRRIALALGAG
jgi:hypothetical protein